MSSDPSVMVQSLRRVATRVLVGVGASLSSIPPSWCPTGPARDEASVTVPDTGIGPLHIMSASDAEIMTRAARYLRSLQARVALCSKRVIFLRTRLIKLV